MKTPHKRVNYFITLLKIYINITGTLFANSFEEGIIESKFRISTDLVNNLSVIILWDEVRH